MMGESNPLAGVLLSKLEEQIELANHLITLIPPDKCEYNLCLDSLRGVRPAWAPSRNASPVSAASLYAVEPARLAHFVRLRD